MKHRNETPRPGGIDPQRGAAFLWLLLIVAGIVVGGIWIWHERSTAPSGETTLTFPVQQEKLRISVVEAGQLKAAKSTDIYCEVRGGATILELIEEGKQVKEGDILVRLDASNLEDEFTAQKIKYEQANAALIQAEKAKEIQISMNQSDTEKAEVNLALAITDKDKYEQGDWKLKQEQADADILLADADKKKLEKQVQDTEELVKLDYAAQTELDSDKLDFQRAKVKLTMSERQKDIMIAFEHKRQLQVLESAVTQCTAELDRVKLRCDADIAQKEADFRSKKATFELETSKRNQLEDSLSKTVITAPSDGLVVYPVNGGGMGGRSSDRDRVEEGAAAREHQLLISLPDTSSMVVVVSVHESAIDKIKLGQPAEVTIDALSEVSYVGRVIFIAPLPDSQNQWLNPDLKIYRCEIQLGGETAALRPGMSASAEIVIDELPSVISVPVHAVHRRGDHYFVYTKDAEGRIAVREVKIGLHNDERVAIQEGLSVGDRIFLAIPPGAPTADFPDAEVIEKTSVEELRQRADAIAPKEAVKEPARDGTRSDDHQRGGRDGRSAGGGNGIAAAPSAEDIEKYKKMSPEEKKKLFEERMKNMTPEERQKMEEWRKRNAAPGSDGAGAGGGQ